MLICPNCQSSLSVVAQQFICSQGHHFDRGKNGDVNLLLVQQKRSKSPGDSKAMVAARRDFLATGVYQPIAERLAGLVTTLSQGEPKIIADAGCGEGYYLRQLQRLAYPNREYFNTHGGALIGWDISKFAVQSAAKQSPLLATWLTASNAAIPLADNSVDILMSGFGFEVSNEFYRVLKSGQGSYLITLDAGEQHLLQLRQIIYDEIKPYQEKPSLDTGLFTLLKQQSISYQTDIQKVQINQLMAMTPHLYRTSAAGKQRLSAINYLPITIDVVCRIYAVKSRPIIFF